MKILLSLIFLNIAISSCATKVNHGYMFEYSDVHLLDVGTDQNSVLGIMGSPTFKSQIEDETWFYMHEKTKSFLFFKPKIIERQILTLNFIGQNISEISKYSLEDQAQNFSFETKHSEVPEHKIGFFKSLFSNIGQVKAQ
jgi:outer membrane protein assembly factor BamE (lipoprotein component of BamABCDE complex)